MSVDDTLTAISPIRFAEWLAAKAIRRFFLVFDPARKRVIASHPELQPLADFVGDDGRDFMEHEGLFFQVSRTNDVLMGAFIHRTCRGQGAGGVRYWKYDTMEDYLRDGLRLSKGMTRKNALAFLWWGGGKGVMARRRPTENAEDRAALYREYGEFIASLGGCYVTAEDVGTNVADMANIFSRTRHTTCIPEEFGGSGNPSVPTARGVVSGMAAALEFLGAGPLAGKTVAVQGMGNVGAPLIGFLIEQGVARVIACDVSPKRVEKARQAFAGKPLDAKVTAADDNTILTEACDILAPCAVGAILNPRTIPGIRARVICGAANNQLEDEARDDALLQKRRILYVPDFLVNRMGIVNCANEQYGRFPGDPAIEQHLSRDWEHSIHQTTLRVLAESRSSGIPPGRVAVRRADELSLQPHPIFGHRGRRIIDALVATKWHVQ